MIPLGWKPTTLGAIASAPHGLVDGPFGSNLPASAYVHAGIPVIRGSNLSLGTRRFLDEGFVWVSESTAAGLSRSICRRGDIVFTKKGTLGQTGYIPASALFDRYLLSSNQMKLTVDQRVGDPLYVYYYVSAPESREKIVQDASVTGVPKTNVAYLRDFPIVLPPLPTQRKIASILAAYDDLIENNNRRIKLLQETAQRIYRELFVDFHYPGHKNVPLADSELGPIPQGWRVAPLRDVLAYHIGGGWGADAPTNKHDQVARVVRGTDIPRVRVFDVATCPTRYHTSANVSTRWLHHGDIVLEVSGGSKGQPVGRAVLVSNELLAELGSGAICASFCKLVRCDGNVLAPEILSHRLTDAYVGGEIGAYQVQSTGITNLRFAQLLESFFVVVPPKATQSAFVGLVGPMLRLTGTLGASSRNLRTIRDLLLPRLISGEIDVENRHIAMPDLAVA